MFACRNGHTVNVRFVETSDRDNLRDYFRSLSLQSRHNRFMAALSELPAIELDRFIRSGEGNLFTLIVTMAGTGSETIVGEARYAFHSGSLSVEFGFSVSDPWHGVGIGTALVNDLERRSFTLGAERIFGDALYSNTPIRRLARKCGYEALANAADCKLIRFEKLLVGPQDIPSAF